MTFAQRLGRSGVLPLEGGRNKCDLFLGLGTRQPLEYSSSREVVKRPIL